MEFFVRQHALSLFSYNGDYNGKQAQKQNILEKARSDGLIAILRPLYNTPPTPFCFGQTLPDSTPPIAKIHPSSKIAVTFESMIQF